MCLCSNDGDLVFRFFTRFATAVKNRSRPRTPGRQMLDQGYLVVELHGARAGIDAKGFQAELLVLRNIDVAEKEVTVFPTYQTRFSARGP